MGIVYVMENMANEKVYVGQTITSFKRRMSCHKGARSLIGSAIRKYGIGGFVISINEIPNSMLDGFERNLIAFYSSRSPLGYNLEDGGNINKRLGDETKMRMSEAWERRAPFSEATRRRMSEARRLQVITQERKRKIAESLIGHALSSESRRKISLSLKGRKLSAETRRRMADAQRRNWSDGGSRRKSA